MIEQETCLFHREISSGDQYIEMLHAMVEAGITKKKATPVVRFADGEYSFYRHSLKCNGLYKQAENVAAIRRSIPAHVKAIRSAARCGRLSPLVFPGNTRRREPGFFSFLRKSKDDDSAIRFLDFIAENGIELNGHNYMPFYAVYAYLVTGRFARLLDGRSLCVVNSEYNEEAFRKWFDAFSVTPRISYVPIPATFMATRWDSVREAVLSIIPSGIDLFLIGAGVGALQIAVDIAELFSAPAIDAGHVLNMMNGRIDKSGGVRLYTIWNEEKNVDADM